MFSERLLSWHNLVAFWLRRQLPFSRTLTSLPPQEITLQKELKEFLLGFDWSGLARDKRLSIVDVGTRNFAVGPVIESILMKQGYEAEIHGIELDANRLLAGFYTRASYGVFYAAQMRAGCFHAMDFLKWQKPVDVVLMLNPFLSAHPLLRWGLPLRELQSDAHFRHAARLLKSSCGTLVISTPTRDEFERASELATQVGFVLRESSQWRPTDLSLQQRPRFGARFQLS